MASAMATHLQAVASFMQQVRHTPAFADVVRAQEAHFTAQLSKCSFTIDEGNLIVAALREAPWPPAILQELLSLVASKTSSAPGACSRNTMQDYRAMSKYLPSKIWSQLLGNHEDLRSKCELILQTGLSLGLRTPSEATYQAFSALVILCHEGSQKASMMDAGQKHGVLVHMKGAFRQLVRSAMPMTCIPSLPDVVNDFRNN